MRHNNSPLPLSAPVAPLTVCVVAHTHWDREWYHGAARFRQRLVALIDALLDGGASPEAPFLLDGQAVTLRDYLVVRPERATALSVALRKGAIEAGPWFVLADTLIPCGEALVRNLEAGARVLAQLGPVLPPPIAYCPDTFGHPAALPLLATGFGLTTAIVWRGAGGPRHPLTDTFRWRGLDGSEVLVHHLPPDGYEFGSALPVEPAAAAARWATLCALFAARAHTGVVLLLNGADHHALQPDLPAALDALQVAAERSTGIDAPHATIKRTTLTAFAARLHEAVRAEMLPTVYGELRDSSGYTWTLGGTLATRAHQKRRNARLERLLLRDVEPWLVLAWLRATSVRNTAAQSDAPTAAHRATSSHAPVCARLTLAQLPALLHAAWETLLETHPHDTLCGCSTDAVARAMEVRQDSVATQAVGLRHAALEAALGHDPIAARTARPSLDGAPLTPIVLRNCCARPRSGLAELTLIDTVADVRVGPGSDRVAPSPLRAPAAPAALSGLIVQTLSARLRHLRRESPQHYPDNDLVRAHRVLAWVPAVPALGVRVLVTPEDLVADCPPAPSAVTTDREADGITLRNGHVLLRAGVQGLDITVGERTIRDACWLESQTDGGDSYTPSLRGTPIRLRCASVTARLNGPLRASVRMVWVLTPDRIDDGVRSDLASASEAVGAARRGARRGSVRAVMDLELDAESTVVRCVLRGVNRRRNHQLRLVWRTDVVGGHTVADAAFGPVGRFPIEAPFSSHEQAAPTMPMHRWCTTANEQRGVTVIGDGLAEVHASDGAVSLTVLRAIGELSRADLPERPGHAGWPVATPQSQAQGRFRARSALLLHGPLTSDTLALIRDAVDDTLLPLMGNTWRDLEVHALAAPDSRAIAGPALIGDAFEASAVTLARAGNALILRAVNLTDAAAYGAWYLPSDGPWLVTPCRLDEVPLAPTERCGRELTFPAGPRETITLHVAHAEP